MEARRRHHRRHARQELEWLEDDGVRAVALEAPSVAGGDGDLRVDVEARGDSDRPVDAGDLEALAR